MEPTATLGGRENTIISSARHQKSIHKQSSQLSSLKPHRANPAPNPAPPIVFGLWIYAGAPGIFHSEGGGGV